MSSFTKFCIYMTNHNEAWQIGVSPSKNVEHFESSHLSDVK